MWHTVVLIFFLMVVYNCSVDNEITFQINMHNAINEGLLIPDAGDHVVVRGSFNSWQGDSLELYDADGDSIYSGKYTIVDTVENVEYKYVIVKKNGIVFWENNPNRDNPPHGNRKLNLTDIPQDLAVGDFYINRYDFHALGKSVLFSTTELQEDYIQLRSSLEKDHCCIYRYTNKAVFDSLFEAKYAEIKKPMAPQEFFRLITPISAAIGCGHSSFWMPGNFWNLGPDKLFPLKIRVIEDLVVVTGDYSDSLQVPVGSVILEINNRSVKDIVHELKINYAADAMNNNFRLSQVERRFAMLYARMYGFEYVYKVTYALPGRKTSVTSELKPANIDAVRADVFPKPQLKMGIIEEKSTAILTINSFGYYEQVDMFRGFIDSCFTQIRNLEIKNLILDLRKNDGGDPFCSVPLFAYLEYKPVPYFAQRYGKYSDFADPIPMAEKNFSGNLYTLIDGRCFSTNGHFCSLLKYNKIGKLIGSQAGSSYTCNAATNTVRLDNTRLQIFVPHKSFAASVAGMDLTKGIIPDFFVEQSYQDFLQGKDSVMDYTFDLIENGE